MARLLCKCGEQLSTSEVPNNIQYHVFSEREWGELLEKDSVLTWEIPAPKNDVWLCPNCQRIYVFNNNAIIRRYTLESD